jgi:hypothetical protein
MIFTKPNSSHPVPPTPCSTAGDRTRVSEQLTALIPIAQPVLVEQLGRFSGEQGTKHHQLVVGFCETGTHLSIIRTALRGYLPSVPSR